MRLNNGDITRLIKACKNYQNYTGSEWMWEQYDDLIHKLKVYRDQHSEKNDVFLD